ncbi:hypothetical protein EMN47_03685 [Prolixibacteraceae bacterium JC049]|nr:hypothetical protein [Prolixibacteraceae bacterium JC049]
MRKFNKVPTLFKMMIIVVCILSSISTYAQDIAFQPSQWLLPQPQQIDVSTQKSSLKEGRILIQLKNNHSPHLLKAVKELQIAFTPWAGKREITRSLAKQEQPAICLKQDNSIEKAQGYELTIKDGIIDVKANDEAGIYYAIASLKQLAAFANEAGYLPQLTITDFPDFQKRGIMLDISRDKVPTMTSLFELIDRMAAWKMNELQLYTEHTYAYQNHQKVWQHSSPMTAEEILELDQYCLDHFIDLVPNQNSFGHMKRWLKNDEYKHLAICENPSDSKSKRRSRESLNPSEKGSLDLMEELYNELLPNFSSEYVNIGCDEVFTLGQGSSKEIVDKKGKGKVYLEYITLLNELVNKNNKKAMFWSDMILHEPELIADLPENMVTMIWGYGANHPFNKQCPLFQKEQIPFYVCPGTSTWQTIIGSYDNALANLINAAEDGKKYGAKGYLITDWGDHGHWQPAMISFPGYLYGASVSWAVEANRNCDVPSLLNTHIFKDKSNTMGALLAQLGKTSAYKGWQRRYFSVYRALSPNTSFAFNPKYTKEELEGIIAHLDKSMELFHNTDLRCEDAELIKQELTTAVAMAKLGCQLGIAQKNHGAAIREYKQIPWAERKILADELEKISYDFKALWLKRNRIGGLRESAGRMDGIVKKLREK